MNGFIDPALAEKRDVFCGYCGGHVKGHHSECLHCGGKFFANKNGYARLCKNPSCIRTECAGHAHGLCRDHHEGRKAKQAATAAQRNCACGNKAGLGEVDCSRCRVLKDQEFKAYFGRT